MYTIRTTVLCAITSGFLLAGTVAGAAETRTITLLGSSDIHGYFVPWDYATDTAFPSGGLSKIASVVKRIRASNPHTVVLDAGDLIQGNFTETFKTHTRNPMMLGLNAIGYDLFVPGNHEFNFGMETVKNTLSTFKGISLGGNIYKTDGSGRYLPAWTVVERGGIKIGFIGITTPMTMEFEAGTDHLKGIEIRKPVADTQAAIRELQGKVDAIVGIMHMGEGNENGVPETGVTDVIAAAPGLDVVFAGHMHQRIAGKDIRGTLVVEPFVFAQNLSRVDLTFEKTDTGWTLKNKSSELLALTGEASDPALEAVYAPYHQELRAQANAVIGQVQGGPMVPPTTMPGLPSVQIEDTALVTLFHAACLHYSQADVVALQIDNQAARLDAGDIKRKDIAFNYQYALGEITNYRFTGAELKTYMEWSADYFNTLKPGDVTPSFNPVRRASKYSTNDFFGGIHYAIDLSKPPGARVTEIRFPDGKPLTPDMSVVVGMNAYRLAQLVGKGGVLEGKKFTPLSDTKTRYGEDDGIIRALIVRYIKEELKGRVAAKADNNWRLTGFDPSLAREKTIVEDLVQRGVIKLASTGNLTGIASVNVQGKVTHTPEQQAALLARLEARLAQSSNEAEKGDIRTDMELVKALKTF
nr:5'-nucleotidase C-terminal domain-containing protein [uncultured Rhodoferax sp.]